MNPVLRQQIKWTEYKKVPIVLAHVEGVYQVNKSECKLLHNFGDCTGRILYIHMYMPVTDVLAHVI